MYAYLEYLKASVEYNSTKKGFYTAVQLARLDANIQEDQLQRYEHMVKHFDKQLLNQLKDREYDVLKLENVNNNEDNFHIRIAKIENTGYWRNRFHFEYVDNKVNFEEAKELFYNEISLAVHDGLITDIEEMTIHRRDFIGTQKGKYYRGNGGRGRRNGGRGYNSRVRGQDFPGQNDRGIDRSFRGRGRNGSIMKRSFKGRRNDW